VLFLDELPEFKRSVLETMRQPLEEGRVTISRAAGTMTFPSQFMLVAGDEPDARRKKCLANRAVSPREIQKINLNRTFGPLTGTGLTSMWKCRRSNFARFTAARTGETSAQIP
jgi:magnesium chelatase family protein